MSHFTVAVFTRDAGQVESLLAPYNEWVDQNSPYAEFMENEDAELDAATGKRGYWYNPNARWDWYTIGGRWDSLLKLKNAGERSNSARVRDCDFSPDEEDYRKAARFWEIFVEELPCSDEEKQQYFNLYKKEYFIQQYGTKENYARHQAMFQTYAFISEDGEWHETGRMGWWGMDDATAGSRESYIRDFEANLEEAKEKDLFITIVDCHI